MRDRYKLFVLKDSKSNSYGMPITSISKGTILRDIQDELQKGQAIFAKHPQDFTLFEIGEYDVDNGVVQMHEVKECVGLVSDFLVNQ